MCFSTTASFTASIVLSAIGVATLTQIRSNRGRLLGTLPLLFSVQQFSEGMVWLSVHHPSYQLIKIVFTYSYLLFAAGLWPGLCPLSVYFLEEDERVKKIILGCVFIGFIQGIYLYSAAIYYQVFAVPFSGNLLYNLSIIPGYEFNKYLYLLLVSIPLLIASDRWLKAFGVLAILSFFLAEIFYHITFASVWCFFAAVLSGGVYLILSNARDRVLKFAEIYRT